jgi:poly(hydroxyalkanoate) granule-associated protein
MARKQDAVQSGDDVELLHTLREAAQQICLAGLTAVIRTQEESAKVLDALRTEGRQGGRAARRRLSGFTDNIGRATRGAAATATRIEQLLEARIARSVQRLGVPSAKDMQRIADRLDALEGHLTRPSTKRTAAAVGTPRTAARRARAAAKKPAVRKRAVVKGRRATST